jgi:hypothetical protein
MMSNLGMRTARDLKRELARAYDGEVPPPYYWQSAAAPPPARRRSHPGEMLTTLPYAILPAQLGRARAVSLDELEELVERLARREELGG